MGIAEFMGRSEEKGSSAPPKKKAGGIASFMGAGPEGDDEDPDDSAPGGLAAFMAPSSQRKATGRIKAPRAGKETPEQLEAYEGQLGALREKTGAPGLVQDAKALGATLLDLLSRPNYAVAAGIEEISKTGSVARGLGLAVNEILSGLGPFAGKKRAFGEVLEDAGYGTTTLADVFPGLEGTWVGHMGSRGAAGLGLDIILDPTTYVTFGATKVGKINALIKGKRATRYLNAAGIAERSKVAMEVMQSLGKDVGTAERRFAKASIGAVDDFSLIRARSKIADEIDRRALARLTDETGDIAKQYLDPGGVKLFGKTVVRGDTFAGFTKPIVEAAAAVPGGDWALEKARNFGDGLSQVVNRMFHPFNELGHLPEGLRDEAIKLHRDFKNSSAAHRGRLITEARELEGAYRKIEKSDPLVGKRWYDIREGVRPNDLTGEEAVLFDKVGKLYDKMGDTLVVHGVLDPAQIGKGGYFFHGYKNLEDLRKYEWGTGNKFTGSVSEQFTKERSFERFEDAVLESRRLNAIAKAQQAAGRTVAEYPILEPNYDVFQNLERYISQHSDALARKAWREDVLARFGKAVDGDDIQSLYELSTPAVPIDSKDFAKVERFFKNSPTFRAATDIAAESMRVGEMSQKDIKDALFALDRQDQASRAKRFRVVDPTKGAEKAVDLKPATATGMTETERLDARQLVEVMRRGGKLEGSDLLRAREIVLGNERTAAELLQAEGRLRPGFTPGERGPVPGLGESEAAFLERAKREMYGLSTGGKKEFLRQLLSRSKSPSQTAAIEGALWDEFRDIFPAFKAVQPGEIGSASLARTLGDKAAEMVRVKNAWTGEQDVLLPRAVMQDLEKVNTRLLGPEFKEFGPLIRGYDYLVNRYKLGVYGLWPASLVRDTYNNVLQNMLDIGLQAFDPKLHKDAVLLMAGRNGTVTYNGLTYSIRQLKEMAKDLNVLVPGQVFAEQVGKGAKLRAAGEKFFKYRGAIENESRVLLWLANMRRGATPRQAADHVADFLFNYGELSGTEKELFRRLIPFYTFTRKNVTLQAQALRRNPGMVINELKPFRGQNDENEQMVEWEAEALKMRMDRDGKTISMITGIDVPLKNLDVLWRGSMGETGRAMIGMVNPVLKVMPEVLLNHDFFLGRDLTRVQSQTVGRAIENLHTPQAMKDWLGYKKTTDAAGRPHYSFDGRRFTLLFRSWVLSRAISTSDRQFRENLDEGGFDWNRVALDVLTGLRRKDIDMDEQMRRRREERIRQAEDALVRRGEFRSFERRYQAKQ